MTETIGLKLVAELEFSEAAYWIKHYQDRGPLKTYATIIDGAFVGAVPELDILALNRVIGLGTTGLKVTTEAIEDITAFYKRAGSKRFFIQLYPHLVDEHLRNLLQERGFRHHNNWAKLIRPAHIEMPDRPSGLEVKCITHREAHLYADIIFSCFDWEDERLREWLAAPVGKPGYKHYMVMKNNEPIAAGAYHEVGEFASMAFAGTLPEYRGLGAQALLLQTRIAEARRSGCRYLVSETAEDKPERPVTSFRNMIKQGFELAYLRQNWILEL